MALLVSLFDIYAIWHLMSVKSKNDLFHMMHSSLGENN